MITDPVVKTTVSFSQKVWRTKYDSQEFFISQPVECNASRLTEEADAAYQFCIESVEKIILKYCESIGIVPPSLMCRQKVIDAAPENNGDSSNAAFSEQARKNSKAEQARVAEEKIKELRANGAQINDLEDSSAVQAGQSSEIASHPEGDTWIETQEAPSNTNDLRETPAEPSGGDAGGGSGNSGDESPSGASAAVSKAVTNPANPEKIQAGQSPPIPIPFVGTLNQETEQITVQRLQSWFLAQGRHSLSEPKLVKGQRGRPRKSRPGTVDELGVSKVQEVTETPPAAVETPAKAYQATVEDLPEIMTQPLAQEGPVKSPSDQISQLRQCASDLVTAAKVDANESRRLIWEFLLGSTGKSRQSPDSPDYAYPTACLPGIIKLIGQKDAEATMLKGDPHELGKLWRASLAKLRKHCENLPEAQWFKVLAIASVRCPTAPGDYAEFMS